MIENRNGLIVKPCVTQSGARVEREAALAMLGNIFPKIQARNEESEKRDYWICSLTDFESWPIGAVRASVAIQCQSHAGAGN